MAIAYMPRRSLAKERPFFPIEMEWWLAVRLRRKRCPRQFRAKLDVVVDLRVCDKGDTARVVNRLIASPLDRLWQAASSPCRRVRPGAYLRRPVRDVLVRARNDRVSRPLASFHRASPNLLSRTLWRDPIEEFDIAFDDRVLRIVSGIGHATSRRQIICCVTIVQ